MKIIRSNIDKLANSEIVETWVSNIMEKINTCDDVISKSLTISREVDEIVESVENERLWMNGSTTKEDYEMHRSNIATMGKYLTELHNLRKLVIGVSDSDLSDLDQQPIVKY